MTRPAVVIDGRPSWLPESLRKRKGEVRYAFRISKAERRIYRKRRKTSVSEWAERHRIITRGRFEGSRFKKETVPYLPGIMDASFFPSVEETVICAADQTGKSFIVDTCIGYAIDRDPGPSLYVYPDEDTATENSKDRIIPMIKKSPRLRAYMTGSTADEAAKRINLQHMQIYMAWARSAIKLANKSIRYLIFDETDKYPDTAGKREADPISKGEKRVRTYRWGRKVWKISTPTIETGPIWVAMNQAQVIFDYHVCCPDCGDVHYMKFENIKWPEGERDPLKVENEELAWYECPACKSRWTDLKRDAAVRWGKWKERAEDEGLRIGGKELFVCLKTNKPKRIAFHITSWLSRFVGLSEAAGAFLRGLSDKNKLKDFQNSHRAEPWLDYTQNRKEDRILALRDDRPRGIVPGGGVVQCLTAGVDTQDNGFYYQVRAWGWGEKLESWGVREGFIDSFEALAKILWEEVYQDAEGVRYVIKRVIQDAMGHRTNEVYAFAKKNPRRLVAFKGEGKRPMVAPINWSNLEYYPPDKKGRKKPIPGGLKLLRADVNYFKDILASKLEIAPEDPGAFHLHAETTEDYARQMCAEYIDEKKQIWVKPEGKANHYWDCEVYNLVAAETLRVKFQDKKRAAAAKSKGRRVIHGGIQAEQ